MTREEIKEMYSMRDIIARYGMKANRAGFIRCPFHPGDRDASMKIYEKDYHCFGCGAHGDIFSFVMKMDGLTFQDAFKELGGTYEREQKGHTGYKGRLSIYHAQKKREQALKEQERLAKKISLNNLLITIYRRHKEKAAPMSDAWCSSCNALERQLYIHEVLSESR